MQDEYTPDLITVNDDNGDEHVFEILDRIETDDARYVALIPYYESPDDLLEDNGELIILEVTEEDGESYLNPIEDDEVFNEVAAAFEERLADAFEIEEE